MTLNTTVESRTLEAKVAQDYEAKGFEVIREPQEHDLPFDLGGYRPDLVVQTPDGVGYIVEVKANAEQVSVDRFREIAATVAQHAGWRFLLVTGEDVSGSNIPANDLLSKEQIEARLEVGRRLLALHEYEGAFVAIWGVLEALLRNQAQLADIPIERLPASSLMNHLYSQGELSMTQFDKMKELFAIRNRLVHGYQTADLTQPTQDLYELANEILALVESQVE